MCIFQFATKRFMDQLLVFEARRAERTSLLTWALFDLKT
jgi:hypothetical protein